MRWSAENIVPLATAVACLAALLGWSLHHQVEPAAPRLPIDHPRPASDDRDGATALAEARLVTGPGEAGADRGAWPSFRGPERTGWIEPTTPLARKWPADGPRRLWQVAMGEGYAGAAIRDGRVYVIDYDPQDQADALRCLSLDDGREIWRQTYPVKVKRSHGMSRTVPAVADRTVVSLGPKCHVIAADAITGELRWGMDLVERFGTTVPPWYAGQCPLIDGGRVILAPAGKQVLMAAVDLRSGELAWTTPNTRGWSMTHASVATMQLGDRRMYIYCGSGGVAGVDAQTGRLLWQTDAWRVRIATVPTPVVIGDGRVFFSGGYNAGSMMMRIRPEGDGYATEVLWRLDAKLFGATQQTPILYRDHLFGVRPDGQMACLDLDGNVVWTSGPKARFGIGPFLIAGGLMYLMDDDGQLTLAETSTRAYKPLATARVLDGHESWGPMALAGDRLIVRDLTTMACLHVGDGTADAAAGTQAP